MSLLRLAVLPVFREEEWPSMDVCAEMLMANLPSGCVGTQVVPRFRRIFSSSPIFGKRAFAWNADRLINRLFAFPRFAGRYRSTFDYFHIVDHSYSQLVHQLPAARTGVYCHDLDTFRCLLEPLRDPQPKWFTGMAKHILAGLQKAAVVFHSTLAVRERIVRHGLVDPLKLRHVPYGVSPEFTPGPSLETVPWIEELNGHPWLAHIGSCIPRKRIDVLLDVVAEVRRTIPELRLVKVSGDWTDEQRKQIVDLGLRDAIIHRTCLPRAEVAEVYRRAPVVLMPSEAEGFGLPVIEALACASIVIASDIPALRETGGDAAIYRPVAAVDQWANAVVAVLSGSLKGLAREDRLKFASRYTWKEFGRAIGETYMSIAA
jgi:glycosyltransferase involved in cell wall biosynthesis